MAKIHFIKKGEVTQKGSYRKFLRRRKLLEIFSGVLNVLLIGFIVYTRYFSK